jgi:transposase-like protein
VVISLTVEDGIAIEVRDEKALLARIVVMYAVVAASCPQKNPAIIACHVAQSNRSSVRWRTAECGRTRAPEFERIAHNNRRTIKRRAIMGLDDVQAGRIKNACNWSEKR